MNEVETEPLASTVLPLFVRKCDFWFCRLACCGEKCGRGCMEVEWNAEFAVQVSPEVLKLTKFLLFKAYALPECWFSQTSVTVMFYISFHDSETTSKFSTSRKVNRNRNGSVAIGDLCTVQCARRRRDPCGETANCAYGTGILAPPVTMRVRERPR